MYRLQEARALAGIGQARAALGEEAGTEFRAARELYAAPGLPAEPLKVVT